MAGNLNQDEVNPIIEFWGDGLHAEIKFKLLPCGINQWSWNQVEVKMKSRWSQAANTDEGIVLAVRSLKYRPEEG